MSSGIWTAEINGRINMMSSGLVQATTQADQLGLTGDRRESYLKPFREALEELYTSDLTLARIFDESDFYVGARGESIGHGSAPVGVVIKLLQDAQVQVTRVARSIAEIIGNRTPQDLQPRLFGLAPGSLYLGFKAPEPPEEPLLEEKAALYGAVREALKAIHFVGANLDSIDGDRLIREAIPDPAVRDTAISAVHDMAPGPRTQIATLTIGGSSDLGAGVSTTLTREARPVLKAMLADPVRSQEAVTYTGAVRAVDLDTARFVLRRIEGDETTTTVRSYLATRSDDLKAMLDMRVQVEGMAERDATGRPRLMKVTAFKILGPAGPKSDEETRLL